LRKGKRRALAVSVFETLFAFGLIVFLYVVGLSFWQPYWLSRQVFHFQEGIPWLWWLRNDTMGVMALVLSAASYLASRYLRNLTN
jgi:hypothetical protein